MTEDSGRLYSGLAPGFLLGGGTSQSDDANYEEAGKYFIDRARYIRDFLAAPKLSPKSVWEDSLGVADLKGLLARRDITLPTTVTVYGTYYPALLLFTGWWERRAGEGAAAVEWRDDLQHWLFHAFEQWGPSWDLTYSVENGSGELVGQVADGDEANSIAVIAPPGKAERVREFLHQENGLFQAKVVADLWRRDQLRTHLLGESENNPWVNQGDFDYCLVLSDDDPSHMIVPDGERPEIYSAYLWQCWAPEEWLRPGVPARLNDVYFVWEHTNLAKRGAVEFNMEALQRKAGLLERARGKLRLLQKSTGLIVGDPEWPTEVFGQLLLVPSQRDEVRN